MGDLSDLLFHIAESATGINDLQRAENDLKYEKSYNRKWTLLIAFICVVVLIVKFFVI